MTNQRPQTPSLSSYLGQLHGTRLGEDELRFLCAAIERSRTVDASAVDQHRGAIALQFMVEANLALVVKLAKRYWFEGVFLDDLVQAGNVGLLQAATTYDLARGAAFSTWAAYSIKSSLLDFLADNQHPVRVPRQVHDRVMSERRHLQEVPKDSPGRRAVLRSISIDAEDASGFRLAERLQAANAATESCEATELRQLLLHLVGQLSDKRRVIMVERYGLDGSVPIGTVQQAQRHGISREAIRQRHRSALSELADLATESGLSSWLEES